MNNLIGEIEKEYMKENVPQFEVGDVVKVYVKVVEGNRERLQAFEGTVIARKNGGLRETFIVRRVSFGVGIERSFPVHSPRIDKVEEQSKKNEERITNLEDNRFLNPNEYGYLNTQVSARVKQVKESHKWELSREQNNQLYRAIGREIKQITGVKCRSQIRFKDFEKVCDFVKTWEPSRATLYNMGMVNLE